MWVSNERSGDLAWAGSGRDGLDGPEWVGRGWFGWGQVGTGQMGMGRLGTGRLGTGRSRTGQSRTGRLQKKFNWFENSNFYQNLKHIYNSSICKDYKVYRIQVYLTCTSEPTGPQLPEGTGYS
jgi:hypothetical protein